MKKFMHIFVAFILLDGCTPITTPEPVKTPALTQPPTMTASPIPTNTEVPTNTPDLSHLDPSSILFEQNFETGTADGLSYTPEDWSIISDETGNHIICNTLKNDYSLIKFGKSWWSNYAIEMRVKSVVQNLDSWVSIFARTSSSKNYYGALNFDNDTADLAFNDPYTNLGHESIQTSPNTWYLLRLEVYGNHIKFYINNQLIGDGISNQRSQGAAAFNASPLLKACFDDIRAWALTETGSIGPAPIIPISLETVIDDKAVGNAGNNWGGYQARIVHTGDGVFTAYIVEGGGYFEREWRLAWRQEDGTWPVIAHGDAGDGPVSLLASEDGTLHIIGWPDGFGTIWSGKPSAGILKMTKSVIPGVFRGFWAYPSAGTDKAGDICVTSSTGGQTPGGTFMWACLFQSQEQWITHTSQIDYKYAYTYVFPEPGDQLQLVANRDVRWSALGYTQPVGTFDYTFNAVGYWRTDDINKNPLERIYVMQEVPTKQYPNVDLNNCHQDAYIDTSGNMHILYEIQGESTQGEFIHRQVVLSPDGNILKDEPLPDDLGGFTRIFQDTKGQFFILGSSGVLYPAGKDGFTLGTPFAFDLKGYTVEYSGIYVSSPRTGTSISDIVDVAFITDNGNGWIYFSLPLPEK